MTPLYTPPFSRMNERTADGQIVGISELPGRAARYQVRTPDGVVMWWQPDEAVDAGEGEV